MYRPSKGAGKRWFTIGDAEVIELGDAIAKAVEFNNVLVNEKVDPKEKDRLAEEAESALAAQTERAVEAEKSASFGVMFGDWLESRAKVQTKGWKMSAYLHKRHASALLDNRPVKEISRMEISNLLDAVATTAPRTPPVSSVSRPLL